jgi:hypothetical protein
MVVCLSVVVVVVIGERFEVEFVVGLVAEFESGSVLCVLRECCDGLLVAVEDAGLVFERRGDDLVTGWPLSFYGCSGCLGCEPVASAT